MISHGKLHKLRFFLSKKTRLFLIRLGVVVHEGSLGFGVLDVKDYMKPGCVGISVRAGS
mgnify:CR=1 FL=1